VVGLFLIYIACFGLHSARKVGPFHPSLLPSLLPTRVWSMLCLSALYCPVSHPLPPSLPPSLPPFSRSLFIISSATFGGPL
jgi:hypothetical protein